MDFITGQIYGYLLRRASAYLDAKDEAARQSWPFPPKKRHPLAEQVWKVLGSDSPPPEPEPPKPRQQTLAEILGAQASVLTGVDVADAKTADWLEQQVRELVPDRDTYRVDFSSSAGVNELLAAVLTDKQGEGGAGAG